GGQGGYGYGNTGGYYGNNPTCPPQGGYGAAWTMTTREVRQIGFAMDNQAFDEDKLRVARRTIGNSNRTILSADLRILLNRFAFDRHRLQLAKFAYERVADPQNFYLVYNSFVYASSYQELDHFLGYNQPYYRPGGRAPAAPRNGNVQNPGRGNGNGSGRPGGRGQRG
ncbi:MAG TPA: hypothetical protein DCP28_21140, partial [Cytophagales bacterium]|nr:hypothetical protein [Cytophagales bacterium]